tara:strand:- start:740 stop:1123 length:384 start_codon:yes stop_codon:yes gene_type:complete
VKNVNKQQMLMDFSYERSNDAHGSDNYTIIQAMKALHYPDLLCFAFNCLNDAYGSDNYTIIQAMKALHYPDLLRLVRERKLDLIWEKGWEKGKVRITSDSLCEYANLRKIGPLYPPEYYDLVTLVLN